MFTDSYYPRINGVTVSVDSYAAELSKIGHTVAIVCLEYTEEQQKNSLFDEKSNDGKAPFKIIRIPSAPLFFSKEDRMMRLDKWYRIKNEMDDFKPDVIHINTEWTIGYFGALYAHHRHIPFVYTFHTMWEDYLANYVVFLPSASMKTLGRNVVKFYLKRADVIIAPTKRIADVVSEYGIKKDVDILPTGIPDRRLEISNFRRKRIVFQLYKKFQNLKGKKILLFAGRIVKEKNLLFLFDVLKKVQLKIPKTALLFVGAGPYAEELSRTAKNLNLEKSVAFTGYIPSSDMVYFYNIAQVFVFPSKTETQGLVTVEAMLSALPVVAIGELGTIDVMQGDHGGFMVHDDVDEFSERVIELLDNPQLYKEKSQEAVKWAQKWKISNLTPKLVENYEKAIEIRKLKDKKIEN